MVMKETLDGFQGGLQIGGRIITNLRYADDIILLVTLEAELHDLVDRLDRVSHKYSLLINVDKTKVMASDGIACRVLIQNELLEQVDTYPGSLIRGDGECITEFRTRLNRGQAIGASLQKIWKSRRTPTHDAEHNPPPSDNLQSTGNICNNGVRAQAEAYTSTVSRRLPVYKREH